MLHKPYLYYLVHVDSLWHYLGSLNTY